MISGFDPQDDVEKSRLAAERQTLGFDPRVRSHELTACKDDRAHAARSAFFVRSAVETPIANAAAGAKHVGDLT